MHFLSRLFIVELDETILTIMDVQRIQNSQNQYGKQRIWSRSCATRFHDKVA